MPARTRPATTLLPARLGPVFAVGLLAWAGAGCAGWSSQPEVGRVPEPAGPPPSLPAPGPAAPGPVGPGPAAPPTSSTTSTSVTTGPGVAAGPATDADRRVVQEVLDRYDRALTELSAAPDAVDDPEDPLRRAWHDVVPAGSELDEAVLDRIRGRRAAGLLVEPVDRGGLSYVHRALEVVRSAPPAGLDPPPEELAFTWCGWSPGLGRRVVGPDGGPGPVVDDAVAHALGTGRITRSGPDDPWVLGSLLESELTVLPAGSDDPCR